MQVVFEDSSRLMRLRNRTIHENRIWWYDPQCDEPLSPKCEKAMKQMGPVNYLVWIINAYQLQIDPVPTNEHEARRTARKAVRALRQYDGEKFIQ